MKFFSTKLIVIAALCAFMGAGSMFASGNSSANRSSGASATAAEMPPSPTAGIEEYDFSDVGSGGTADDTATTHATVVDNQPSSWDKFKASKPVVWLQSWFSSTPVTELTENNAIEVVGIIQDLLDESSVDAIHNGYKAQTRIKKMSRSNNGAALQVYKENGVTAEMSKIAKNTSCFVVKLQATCKSKNEDIIVRAIKAGLDYKQVELLKNALTTIHASCLPTWEALFKAWEYTYNPVRNYFTYPLWYYVFSPMWQNKFWIAALFATWCLSRRAGKVVAPTQSTGTSTPASISTQSQLKEVRLP